MSVQLCSNREGFLSAITSLVMDKCSTEQILDAIYEDARQFLTFDRIGWAELHPITHIVSARWTRAGQRTLLRRGFSAPLLGSSLYFVMRQRKPRVMDDLLKYLEHRPQSRSTRLIAAEGIRSSITCPLYCGQQEFGFLFFSSYDANTYTQADTPFAMAIAKLLSLKIASEETTSPLVERRSPPICEKLNRLPIQKLAPGMVLRESLRSRTKNLLLASGHELTEHSIKRLCDMQRDGEIEFAMVEIE